MAIYGEVTQTIYIDGVPHEPIGTEQTERLDYRTQISKQELMNLESGKVVTISIQTTQHYHYIDEELTEDGSGADPIDKDN